MTKDQKLDKLDDELLDAMLHIMDKGKKDRDLYGSLSDLATVSNYLAKNNKTAEKKKSSVEDEVKKRAADAKERRLKKLKEDEDEDEF
jgi:hypothetical protein